MFCSLFGLSPVDIILQRINLSTVKGLTGLLNNRFDADKLQMIKAEFQYYHDLISNGPVFDYVDREDRVLAKRLNASRMIAFGADNTAAEERLSNAPRDFSGNFNSKEFGVIALSNDRSKEIVSQLHNSLQQFKSTNAAILVGEFHDERFFGKSLSELSSTRSALSLFYIVSDRLDNNDDIEKLWQDSIALSKYITESTDDSVKHFTLPTSAELETLYQSRSGKTFDSRQTGILQSLFKIIEETDLTRLVPNQISSLFSALIYCFIAEDQYDKEVSDELEKCGIFSFNTVKAEMLLNMVSSISFVSEGRAKFSSDNMGPNSYPQAISAIKRVTENYIIPVGLLKEEVI